MKKLLRKTLVVVLTLGFLLGTAGSATASHPSSRADGVCGGVGGGHYNPLTGECDSPVPFP